LKYTPNDAQTYELQMKLYQAIGDKIHAQQAAAKIQEIMAQEQGE